MSENCLKGLGDVVPTFNLGAVDEPVASNALGDVEAWDVRVHHGDSVVTVQLHGRVDRSKSQSGHRVDLCGVVLARGVISIVRGNAYAL